ncbi:MAG: DUF5076 domain-containing protein [Pseudomonadota bacterium]
MRDEGVPQPLLVVFPTEGGEPQVLLDPQYFVGLDEVGLLLSDLAKHYARAFLQSGRARSLEDAIEQIQEIFDADVTEGLADLSGESSPT